MEVRDGDFDNALNAVLSELPGITALFQSQWQVLKYLINGDNIFLTSPTNSGKSLPPLILPKVCHELKKKGYSYPSEPRVLFVTALNSLQLSMLSNAKQLGIRCAAITKENIIDVLKSDVSILFIGPEILKIPKVTKALISHRSEFVCKVVDEAHLGVYKYSFMLIIGTEGYAERTIV